MSRPMQFDRIMSPLNLSHDPRFRRRGRQPTACTECNRRKQRCDGLQPCHHCAKRNVNDLCRFPDQKPKPRPRPYSDHSEGSATARMSSGSASDDSDNPFKRKSNESDTRSPKRPAFFVEKLSSPLLNSPGDDRSDPPPTRRPSLQDLVHHSIPVSSERASAQTPTPPPWERGGPRPPQPQSQSQFRGTRTPDSWGSQQEDGLYMQENGALGYGSLAVEGHGDESGHHQLQFYGTSHFGPRAAAEFFQEMSGVRKERLNVSDTHYRLPSLSELDQGPYSLASHIRALDSRLPPRSLCERWMDMLHESDFRAKYGTFWAIKGEFEDMTRIDVRWFALFQIVLAFGALLDRQPSPSTDPVTLSNQFFVGARCALSEAPSFGGESIDTVRAYSLLSHYLVMTRRVPEAWNMLGSAVRASEAQGFHIDGEKWKDLPPQEAELRRRLWAQMYCLDRSISYFLGRPLAIHDDKFSVVPPANIPDSELPVLPRPNWPLTTPTKSTFLILHYRLAQIIGRILTTCFGLSPRKHADVMACEHLMVEWIRNLPPVFNLYDPDLRWDEQYSWLRLQRQTLISKFHQARIALHRPYLLHNGYTESRIACVVSAGAELRNRLHLLEEDVEALDRFKWMTVASGFAPACILGLLLARNKREDRVYDYDEIRALFIAYIAAERRAARDHSADSELQVLDMMLSKADVMRGTHPHPSPVQQLVPPPAPEPVHVDVPVPHVRNGALTLAPPAEEWLPAGRPWEPRPPYDPSAAAFPAADDMQSWNSLLNFIGAPAEAQPWYDADAVVIEEELR
ncbi:hypothetical protein CcaverHIS002_0211270 [Cutaneotrichosporon cavernicola]|nr:hypothetical protein CcaverHIS002_0211270 [Cutaneotrichosporon cavernicola]